MESFSCHFSAHKLTASRSCCKRKKSLLLLHVKYNLQSSAKIFIRAYFKTETTSLMYSINIKGPNTDPWGTTLETFSETENLSPILTTWFLSERKFEIKFNILPWNSYFLNLYKSLPCGTESKAFAKSKYIISTCEFFSSMDRVQSSKQLRSWSSVE